jgi:hypothetical protein
MDIIYNIIYIISTVEYIHAFVVINFGYTFYAILRASYIYMLIFKTYTKLVEIDSKSKGDI